MEDEDVQFVDAPDDFPFYDCVDFDADAGGDQSRHSATASATDQIAEEDSVDQISSDFNKSPASTLRRRSQRSLDESGSGSQVISATGSVPDFKSGARGRRYRRFRNVRQQEKKSEQTQSSRLHPIAPFTPPHVAMSDAVVAGYFIPKGSHVILSRMGLGRNPDVREEPLKFKPERHLASGAEVVLTEQNLRFISFSTGRRGCVAATLGSCMTVMLLARLLQGFEWSAPGGAEKVDLRESVEDLFMATPLAARAVPRLPVHLYQAAV
uniref:Cytochrome P450 n=1 Tax=Kalanchoe fedtschenkoi TaxID=63787 RepID=A0A7N0V1W5_KALFE